MHTAVRRQDPLLLLGGKVRDTWTRVSVRLLLDCSILLAADAISVRVPQRLDLYTTFSFLFIARPALWSIYILYILNKTDVFRGECAHVNRVAVLRSGGTRVALAG